MTTAPAAATAAEPATGVPLVTRALDAIVAWHAGRPIAIAELLADAGALGRRLPARGALINACANRYAFLVGFVACLLNGRVCLLPGDRTASRLAALRGGEPDCQVLVDDATAVDGAAIPVEILTGAPVDAAFRGVGRSLDADRIVAVAFTSGTTGEPLGHAKRWGTLMRRIEAVAERFKLMGPSTTAIVATVPQGHMYGFETTILLPLRAAVAIDSSTPLYPDDVRQALARLPGPRVLVTSPVHLRALADGGPALPPLDAVISATAPLDADLAGRVEARLATELLEIYGCTEAGTVASRRTVRDHAWTPFDGLWLEPGDDDA
ncbi:MAG: AMP-binding protein, partial [Proteobacteria bacterium]|nr:AMP-binding protein [Pseudomonadota bacterium]